MKIGIICGKTSEECLDKQLVKTIPKKYKIYGLIHTDVALAYIMKNKFPDIQVDIIFPKDISNERLQKNDINIPIGYDIINAINDDPYIKKFSGKAGIDKLDKIYQNKKNKIFPSYEFMAFIWDKKKYLQVLQKHKIPISPTIFIKDNVQVKKLLQQVQKYKWKEFIIKPIGGTSSAGLGKFKLSDCLKDLSSLKEYFEVYRGDIVDIDLTENWIEFISQIISPSLSKLFLFDGEKILHYADPQNTSALLIQGIQTLFGADLIKDLEDDLKLLKKRIIKSFDSEVGSDLDELDQATTQLQKLIKTTERNLEKNNDDLNLLNKEFDILENKFDAYGLKKLDKANELEQKLQAFYSKKEDILREQRVIVSASMPLALVQSQLKTISSSSSESSNLVEYDNKLKAFEERDVEILKQLKKTNNSDVYNDLKEYLSSTIKTLHSSKPVASETNFISSTNDHLVLRNELENEVNNFSNYQGQLEATLLQIDQLERSIARVPDTKDSKTMFKNRDSLIKKITNTESTILELNTRLELDQNQERILTAKYKQAFDLEVDKLQAESVQSKQLQRIKYTENILEKFNKEIIARSLDDIEKLVTQKFQYLIRKDSLVDKFSIEKNTYILSAVNEKGMSIELIDLSAGERQILAISILWSLSELSKTNIPVIIDTPLGRLDSKHRNQLITKYFPEAGPQTIILSTDEEIVGDYYKTFKPYIGKEYLCSESKEDSGAGVIKEGYF